MAYDIRRTPDAMLFGLIAVHNAKQVAEVASFFHADRKQVTSWSDYTNPTVTNVSVTSANATDSATAITLVNEIKTDLNLHYADTISHDTAVSAAITTATATDEATAITLANAIKADYNTHCSESNVHFNNDSSNTVSSDDATDSATLVTLVNEIKGDVNTHMASKPLGCYINIVSA